MAETDSGPMIDRKKYGYETVKYVDSSGKTRSSVGRNDAVARAMLGIGSEELLQVVKKNSLGDKIAAHYGNVNNGQWRMFVGNALRAKVKKGEAVVIGKYRIESLDQEVEIREPEGKAAKAPAEAAAPEKKVRRKKAA